MKIFKFIFSLVLILISGAFASSCSTDISKIINETVGIQNDDNGVLSVCLEIHSDNPIVDADLSIKRLEFPKDYDTTLIKPEHVIELLDC